MIYLIAGRPRSGKSYEAVKYHAIEAVKAGRKVITNLPLNVDHFVENFGEEVRALIEVRAFDYTAFDSNASVLPFSKPADYQDEWRDTDGKGPLYIVDEAHFSLPKGATPKPVVKFYTMHGHYGIDILLMTQNPRQLDVDVLNLVELVYRTIKNTALGSSTTYTKKVQDGWRGEVVNTEQRKYDKSIFPFYTSHTQSKDAVIEASARDVKPLWKHWSFMGAGICLVIFFVIIFSHDVNPLKAPPPKVSQVQTSPGTASQQTGVASGSVVQSVVSKVAAPKHPYYKIDLHVTGSSLAGLTGAAVRKIHFVATQFGKPVFNVTDSDLMAVGYRVSQLNDCLVEVTYKDTFHDYLTCDGPNLDKVAQTPDQMLSEASKNTL